MNTFDYLKMFLTFMYNNNKKKDKVAGGAFKIQITDKWVIFVIYKELLQINKKKANKLLTYLKMNNFTGNKIKANEKYT